MWNGIRHNFDAPKSCQDLAKKLGLLQGIWRWALDGTHCWVTKIWKKLSWNVLKRKWKYLNSTSPSYSQKLHQLTISACLWTSYILHCYVSYGYDHSEAQKLQFWHSGLWIPPGFSHGDMVYLEQLNLHQTEIDAAQSGTKLHGTGPRFPLSPFSPFSPWIHQTHENTHKNATKINNPMVWDSKVPWQVWNKKIPPCGPCHLFQNLSLYLCLPIFHLWTFQGWKSLRRIERWQFTGPFFQLRFGLVLGGLGTLATFLKHCKLHTREIHSIVLIILISRWQTAQLSSTLVDLAFPQAPPFMAVRGPPKVLSKFVINWTWTVCEFVMNPRCLTFIRTASCVSSCDVWAPECH